MEKSRPWAVCRYHLELASTYKDLAISEDEATYFETAKEYYLRSLYEFAGVAIIGMWALPKTTSGFSY